MNSNARHHFILQHVLWQIDKVLSILEDFSSIAPHLLDVLELKMLLLQKKFRKKKDVSDALASLISGSDEFDLLVSLYSIPE